jgi:hypothetical protein
VPTRANALSSRIVEQPTQLTAVNAQVGQPASRYHVATLMIFRWRLGGLIPFGAGLSAEPKVWCGVAVQSCICAIRDWVLWL